MRPLIVLAALLAAPFAVADDPPGYCATPPEEVGEHHFWYSYYHSPCIFVSNPIQRCACALDRLRLDDGSGKGLQRSVPRRADQRLPAGEPCPLEAVSRHLRRRCHLPWSPSIRMSRGW